VGKEEYGYYLCHSVVCGICNSTDYMEDDKAMKTCIVTVLGVLAFCLFVGDVMGGVYTIYNGTGGTLTMTNNQSQTFQVTPGYSMVVPINASTLSSWTNLLTSNGRIVGGMDTNHDYCLLLGKISGTGALGWTFQQLDSPAFDSWNLFSVNTWNYFYSGLCFGAVVAMGTAVFYFLKLVAGCDYEE
jgi:hypothetical protein